MRSSEEKKTRSRIRRIDGQPAHVERALIDQRVARHQPPVRAAVVGAPKHALPSIESARRRARPGERRARFAPSRRPAIRCRAAAPRRAAVGRLEDAVESDRRCVKLHGTRRNCQMPAKTTLGLSRIDRNVRRAARRARDRACAANPSAVDRAIDAARRAVAIRIADRRDPRRVASLADRSRSARSPTCRAGRRCASGAPPSCVSHTPSP